VNANPSGSRTPSTGSWGRSEARREVAAAAVPSPCQMQTAALTGEFRRRGGEAAGTDGGTRRAKMVCRGALVERRAVQGRVGDLQLPRHIASHLVSHLLLSANTSAPADAARPGFPSEAGPLLGKLVSGLVCALRRAAQPGSGFSPRLEARDTDLVRPRCGVRSTPACELSRGKGVLAA
jgi:hypothetical protein